MFSAPTLTFSVSSRQVPQGGYITLTWGSTNAQWLKINGYPHDLSGTKQSQVNSNKDYVVEATGPHGTARATISITVTTNNPPRINLFVISPEIMNEGNTAKLTWQTTGAESVTIDNGIGIVPATGQRDVSPIDDTVYRITATSAGGVATAIARITVARLINGGVRAAGSSPIIVLRTSPDAVGGVIDGGYAITLAQYNEMTKSGSIVGGLALTRAQFKEFMKGGGDVGPTAFSAFIKAQYNIVTLGGVKASGAANIAGSKKTYNETMSGGAEAGGGYAESRDLLPDFIDTGHDKIPVFGRNYTHKAIQSGDWSDPDTWDVGTVPVFGNDVYIPLGREVTISDTLAAAKEILLGGHLRFFTNVNTKLFGVTCLTLPGSHFHAGDESDPIAPGVKCEAFVIADVPINTGASGFMMLGENSGGGEVKPFTASRTTMEPRKGDLGIATEGGNCMDDDAGGCCD